MDFRLVTIHGEKIHQNVYEVILPTVTGEISVFPGHEPLVTIAKTGVVAVRYKKEDPDDELEYFAISGGVVEVDDDYLKILVDEADRGDDIVEADSLAALERAKKMREDAQDQVELEKAHQLVDRHEVRLKVAELRRRSRRHHQRSQSMHDSEL